MVNIVPVSNQRHTGKAYRQSMGFGFAATQAVVPLMGAEFARAAVAMPIAFIEHSGRYVAVAVMSPIQGRNLFISPTGQWLGLYLPVSLRSFPFALAQVEGSDKFALCVDEESGCLVDADADPEAARFFEVDGSPTAGIKAAIEFLEQVEQNRLRTDAAVTALAEARLIQPWPLVVAIGNQQVTAGGLYRIDEAALNALDEETFLKLRKSSSLALAYAQMISTQTVSSLTQMSAFQQQFAQQAKPLPPVSSVFATDDGGMIRFS